MRFDFQLNVAKDTEYAIAETIKWLKSQGLYSKTIRDGIRLICDLRAGNLDVLFELFPWVRAEFLEYMTSVKPQKSDTELVIAEHLERIETMLSDGGNRSQVSSGVGEPKAMSVPSIPAPTLDDDNIELTITKAEADGKATAGNFLASAFALQNG
jgi:hypothetical protein